MGRRRVRASRRVLRLCTLGAPRGAGGAAILVSAAITALLIAAVDGGADPAADPSSAIAELETHFGDRPKEETRARLTSWLEANPAHPEAARAALWLGDLALDANDLDVAARAYAKVKGYGGRFEARGEKGLADVHRARREYREAIAGYARVAQSTDSYTAYIGRTLEANTREHWHQRTRAAAIAIAIALLCLARLGFAFWKVGTSALWPLPWALSFYAGLAPLAAIAAAALDRNARFAVWTVLGGGLAVVAAQVAHFGAAPPRPGGRIAWAVIGALCAAGLLYFAIVSFDLARQMGETLSVGPER